MSIPFEAGSYGGVSWGYPADPYRIEAATGFRDLPQLRRRVTPHSQADGAARSKYRLDEHILQLTLHVVPILGQTVDQSCRLLEAATPRNAGLPGTLLFDNSTKRATCFVANRAITPSKKDNYAKAVVQFELSDPKVYSEPITVVPTSTGSAITVSNLGNDRTGWVAFFSGTAVNPTITLGIYTLTVPINMAGGTLVIDVNQLTCVFNGSRVSETPASDWPLLELGANTVGFACDSGSSTVSFQYRSAWA
jgi:tail protein